MISILVIQKDYDKKKKQLTQVERSKMDTKFHVSVYDSNQKNFDKWRDKFESYCYTRGWGECLYKDGDSNLLVAMKG